jgi:hypothetical protein
LVDFFQLHNSLDQGASYPNYRAAVTVAAATAIVSTLKEFCIFQF